MTRLEVAATKGGVAVIASFAAYMIGLFNEAIITLVLFMAADYTTGMIRGYATKTMNSTIGLIGIFKKICILIMVGMAAMIEYYLIYTGFSPGGYLILVVSGFFIVNEGLSILENCVQIGAPVPDALYNALEKLHREPGQRIKKLPRNRLMQQVEDYQWNKEAKVERKKSKKKEHDD